MHITVNVRSANRSIGQWIVRQTGADMWHVQMFMEKDVDEFDLQGTFAQVESLVREAISERGWDIIVEAQKGDTLILDVDECPQSRLCLLCGSMSRPLDRVGDSLICVVHWN